jgi:hypothetical protein
LKNKINVVEIDVQELKINPLKCLVAHGADVDEVDDDMNTPLHCLGSQVSILLIFYEQLFCHLIFDETIRLFCT